MFKNYLKTAWRSLKKNRSSSIINIGGLAVGMTVAILIGLWMHDEMSFNKSFDNYKRIARVMQFQTYSGNVGTQQSIPFPLGEELQTTYGSHFKYVVMASWQGDHFLTLGDKIISTSGIYIDVDAPRLLSLKMIEGDDNGLKDPNSILLSASSANVFFGNASPINKLIKIDNRFTVKVTGVYEDIRKNTAFADLNFIAPWSLYITSAPWILRTKDQWDNNSFQLFTQIADNDNFNAINQSIATVILHHTPQADRKINPLIFLHPMADWHLRSSWDNNGNNTGGLIQYVWLFGIVGVFVLLLACINFMNLSTARSEKRAKEVGIRKAVGSVRRQLVSQFYCESSLVVALAFFISLGIAQLLLPWFNGVAGKYMSIPWLNPIFWVMCITFMLITSVLAGSYPALYLSSFNPVKVLKGTFRTGRFAALPRKVLVVAQFTISLTLIIATIIVYNEIQYSKNRPIGYDRNGLMMIQMKSADFYGKLDLLRTDLKNSAAIAEIAASSSPVTDVWTTNNGFEWEGKDPNIDEEFANVWVTHDFGKTVGWKFNAGRDFSRAFATDSSGVVLNKAAVKFMNLKDPIGTRIHNRYDKSGKQYTVVGVIDDMLMQSPFAPVQQTIYFLNYENVNWIELKLNPRKRAAESLAKIQTAFKKYIPSASFDYKFADTEFAAKFASEDRIGTLATFFAALAVFISCLGLFGLASYVAEQRTKEIGIRKVLGASVFNLWNLLSKEFVLLVIISFAIATPVSYYFMNTWLQNYQYRIQISWWFFATAGVGTLIITILTVTFQSIKAAIANPVKSLKSE